jgi:phytoene/squalene synthetase
METLMENADGYYTLAREGIPHLPRPVQRPILLASLTYQVIHGALRRNGYYNFNKRAATTALDKAGFAWRSHRLLGKMNKNTTAPKSENNLLAEASL